MCVAVHAMFRRDARKVRARSRLAHAYAYASSGFGRFFVSPVALLQEHPARIR